MLWASSYLHRLDPFLSSSITNPRGMPTARSASLSPGVSPALPQLLPSPHIFVSHYIAYPSSRLSFSVHLLTASLFKTSDISILIICVRVRQVHSSQLPESGCFHCFSNYHSHTRALACSQVVLQVKGHPHLLHFFQIFPQDISQVISPLSGHIPLTNTFLRNLVWISPPS